MGPCEPCAQTNYCTSVAHKQDGVAPRRCCQAEAEVRALIREAQREEDRTADDVSGPGGEDNRLVSSLQSCMHAFAPLPLQGFEALEQFLEGLNLGGVQPSPTAAATPAIEQDAALQRWRIDFKELEMGRCIGSGSFAKVHCCCGCRQQNVLCGVHAACEPTTISYMPTLPLSAQVYFGKWRETVVAVKMLGTEWLKGSDALGELHKARVEHDCVCGLVGGLWWGQAH